MAEGLIDAVFSGSVAKILIGREGLFYASVMQFLRRDSARVLRCPRPFGQLDIPRNSGCEGAELIQ